MRTMQAIDEQKEREIAALPSTHPDYEAKKKEI